MERFGVGEGIGVSPGFTRPDWPNAWFAKHTKSTKIEIGERRSMDAYLITKQANYMPIQISVSPQRTTIQRPAHAE